MASTIVAYSSLNAAVTDNHPVTATAASGDKWALDVNVVSGGGGGGGTLDYGVSSLALRTAAQIGNASGAAAFGAGATSTQTLRVVLPTDQSAIPVTQSGSWTVTANLGTIAGVATETTLAALSAKLNTLGQKTMANSAPVVIASDQSAVPASQSGTWNITNISGTVSLPTGAATAANQSTEITSLQLIDNLVLNQGSTTSGQQGVLVQGAVSTAPPTYTDAQTSPFSLDTTGNLRTYDVAAELQLIAANGLLGGIDGNIFNINASTSNLNTIVNGYVANNAFATGRGVPAMAEFDDTATDLPTEDRVYMLRMTGNRGLHVNLRTDGGAEFATSSNPAAVVGSGAEGTAIGNPVTIAMQDLTTGLRVVPSTFDFLGATYQLNLNPDLALNFLQYAADGSMNCRTGSPDGTLANAVYLATDSSRNQLIVGNVAHDATDSGNPIKVGSIATSLTSEQAAVSASGDRVHAYFDTKGYQHVKTNAHRSTITQVMTAQVFNNVTTTANSSTFDCTRYRYLVVYVSLTESGSATDIRLRAQFDRGSSNFHDWYIDQWVDLRWPTGVMPVTEIIPVNQVVGTTFRVRADATGTTAVNTITASIWVEGIT